MDRDVNVSISIDFLFKLFGFLAFLWYWLTALGLDVSFF